MSPLAWNFLGSSLAPQQSPPLFPLPACFCLLENFSACSVLQMHLLPSLYCEVFESRVCALFILILLSSAQCWLDMECVHAACPVAQLCLFCDPMDCMLPGSSVHGISQARTLKWVAISCSRGSSQPRDRTQVSCIAGGFFASWATRKPKNTGVGSPSLLQRIFQTQDRARVSHIEGRFFTNWAIREAHLLI